MQVYSNGCDWYVAESVDDAYAARFENDGTTREEQIENDEEFKQCPNDVMLSILVNEDGHIDDHGVPVKLTMEQWAEREGRGILCSMDY